MHLHWLFLSCLLDFLFAGPPAASLDDDGFKLKKLAVVFRHGDRTPYTSFPTDPNPVFDETNWPDGLLQLTFNGKRRMYDLGKYLRTRYSDFLSKNPLEVSARSSSADRCINSMALVLAAAYPPKEEEQIDPGLNWQPTPIHTEAAGVDGMLNDVYITKCGALQEAKDMQNRAEDVLEYEEKHREFLMKIANYTGAKMPKLADVDMVYDTLQVEQENNKTLPVWATEDFMKELKELDEKIFCVNTSTILIQKLEIGVLLHDIKTMFIRDTGHKRVFFYVTHDSRMTSLIRVLNGFQEKRPKYGSTIVFEFLVNKKTKEEQVKLLFLPETWNHEPISLTPKGCSSPSLCPARKFWTGLRNFLTDPQTHNLLCRRKPSPDHPTKTNCFSTDPFIQLFSDTFTTQ